MRASLASILGLLLPLVAVAVAGCTEDFVATGGAGGGTTTNTTGGAGTGAGGAGGQTTTTPTQACDTLVDDACNNCLVDACATPYCKCTGESDCIDLLVCSRDAQTVDEHKQCWAEHKDSISLAGRLQTCGSLHCADCKLPAVDECQVCEYEKCSTQTNNCYASSDCLDLLACLTSCPMAPNPAECQTNCPNMYPGGVQPLQQLYSCTTSFCASPCAT